MRVARRGHGAIAPHAAIVPQNYLTIYLILFANNAPRMSQRGTNKKFSSLRSQHCLFCTPFSKWWQYRPLLRWLVEYTYQFIASPKNFARPQSAYT